MALAGFASVVVVFRSDALDEWAPIDKLRLQFLLGCSVVPLISCIVAMLLLSVQPPPPWIWRACSGFSIALALAWVLFTMKGIRAIASGGSGIAGSSGFLSMEWGSLGLPQTRCCKFTTLPPSTHFGRSSQRSSCSLSQESSSSFGSFFCHYTKHRDHVQHGGDLADHFRLETDPVSVRNDFDNQMATSICGELGSKHGPAKGEPEWKHDPTAEVN